MDEKQYIVYIMANHKRGTMYAGITSDLKKRVWQHKEGIIDGFTKRYDLKRLVYYEIHSSVEHAIKREKRLKRWNREWKYKLIERDNPSWMDLLSEPK